MTAQDPLEAAFGTAAPEHFAWQTTAPFVSERERELIRGAFLPLGERVLDLGCGEGATLRHLGDPAGAVGVDLFEDKIAFARAALPGCQFHAASALDLPFDAGRFDHVLVRDLVHHIEEPSRLFDECHRVLRPGGRIDVLEPCRNNPLIFAHALLRREERGELRSTEAFLRREIGRRFRVESASAHQPLPIHRLLFHPDMGSPALAERPWIRALINGAERLAGALMPTATWAYLHVRAVKAPA